MRKQEIQVYAILFNARDELLALRRQYPYGLTTPIDNVVKTITEQLVKAGVEKIGL